MSKLIGVILAAGLGKRMNSSMPKVLHEIMGVPLIEYSLRAISTLNVDKIVVIVRSLQDSLSKQINDRATLLIQDPPLGTGDALKKVLPLLNEDEEIEILVIPGDTPFISGELLKDFYHDHKKTNCQSSILTTNREDPTGYGRILRDLHGVFWKIVEERDANSEQKKINEVNTSIYLFNSKILKKYLPSLSVDNVQGEYYLTDIFQKLREDNFKVNVYYREDAGEMLLGINNRKDLVKANKILKDRIIEKYLDSGVTIYDPDSTYIEEEVFIEKDVIVYPGSFLIGKTKINRGSVIGPQVLIKNSTIGSGCKIYFSEIEGAYLEDEVKVGPFSHLRAGSYVKKGAKIGNFSEIKNTIIGENTKASHVSYLGDATIGDRVNIGAGTIICNFDGEEKHPTIIEDEAFIGSNSTLIAPLKIGKNAYVAGGSVINIDVPAKSLAIARERQVIKDDWVKKRKDRRKNRG